MFNSFIALAQSPSEAVVVAEALEAVARALREWDAEAWKKVQDQEVTENPGLFERLTVQVAPVATDRKSRAGALRSAEASAAVLRVLWPETTEPEGPAVLSDVPA
jgi:hypothetical protein